MRLKWKSFIGIILVVLSLNVAAKDDHKIKTQAKAKDPVSWSLNRTFQNPVYVGRSYSVTYTFTSQLPFTMVKPIIIQKNASPANEFTYVDNCSGKKLTPRQSCTVQATFAPTSSGSKSLQLAITGYDNNVVRLPTLYTQASGSSVTVNEVYGNVSQSLPGTMQTTQTGNYIFTFTNSGKADATGVTVNVTQSVGTPSYTSTCTSTLAKNGGTCSITGSYTPTTTSPNVQSVTATLNYNQSKSASVATSTVVSNSSATGVVGSIVGNYYLPAVMTGGPTQLTLWFIFTNNGPGSTTVTTTGTPVVATIGGASVTLTPVFNHCSNTPLNVGAQCDIQYQFQASTVVSDTPVTVDATVSYTGSPGGNANVLTSTTIVPTLSTSRTLTFVNNCNFPVWFSLNGGQLATSPTCTSDAQCPTGTSCSSITNKCFWTNYAPNSPGSGSSPYRLDASGGAVTTNTVTIPATSADPAIQWSGNISASLGCDQTSSCTQADCGSSGGSASCQAGKGFTPPATQAEITMNLTTSDSYDVEVINGFHIPVSMAPSQYVTANNYSCGNPGNFASSNGFGSCNWQTAVPPGNGYYWTTGTGESCKIATPKVCDTAGQVCGLDSNLNQKCGNFLGYWTGDQVCSVTTISSEVSSYFQCNTPLAGLSSTVSFPSGSVLYDLMACAVPKGDVEPTFNSCYLTYSSVPANNQLPCCGCVDWWNVSGTGANPNTQSCTQSGQATPQTDPVWNQYIQNTVGWLKKACPSAYTYPFDDKTSGFSCTDTLPGSANSTNYTITFCQGNTGLPAGLTEGRV